MTRTEYIEKVEKYIKIAGDGDLGVPQING
jgi:hypothetical protein